MEEYLAENVNQEVSRLVKDDFDNKPNVDKLTIKSSLLSSDIHQYAKAIESMSDSDVAELKEQIFGASYHAISTLAGSTKNEI